MANNFLTNLRAARSNASNTANNLNTPVTRGDMQKQRQAQSSVDPNAFYNFLRMVTLSPEVEKSEEQTSNNIQTTGPETPKTPSFKYREQITDSSREYWRPFLGDDVQKNYDKLYSILDKASSLNNFDDAKEYMKQLKDTNEYKTNSGIRTWINDLEALYYEYGKDGVYDIKLPVEIMRYHTEKAKQERARIDRETEIFHRLTNPVKRA